MSAPNSQTIQEPTKKVIQDLMRELNDAYKGLHTLPADHPAQVAYKNAWKHLEGR